MNKHEDQDKWINSRELWCKGAVTKFIEEQIAGLQDTNGLPLPDHAKQFFLDILYLRIKPPAKEPSKPIYLKSAVKQYFAQRLKIHQINKMTGSDSGTKCIVYNRMNATLKGYAVFCYPLNYPKNILLEYSFS